VGAAAVVIEFAFLLVYRTGWNLSVASAIASAAIALILIPLGVLVFREHISALNIVGLLMCLAGLALAVRR
jgi:multidrug transporter EmrE-like cation transporter